MVLKKARRVYMVGSESITAANTGSRRCLEAELPKRVVPYPTQSGVSELKRRFPAISLERHDVSALSG